ncbi:MAG: Trk family potassium uptake protein [Clostridia bacterium]|nr:Trk family potassium uptake protein [Clostridia bacterium]
MNAKRRGIRPIQILPLGFLAVILIGAVLLSLPIASADGRSLPFFDALFTATSASCVTGLVVVDTGTHFTLFGQIILLILIQLGGLGFMSAATLLFRMLGRRISLRERMTIAEAFSAEQLQGVVKLCLSAVALTFIAEGIGAILLATRFVPLFGWGKGLWFSVFHSISAFCNAGFDLLGNYQSLTPFVNDITVNITVMALILVGGLGFGVILDLREKKTHFKRFRLQTKLVLVMSAVLVLGGAALFLLFEYDNPATLGEMGWGNKILASFFQSVTCRTAGFNTIDQLTMTDPSKLLSVLLMFTGGAPAGTAGGIKTTTILVVLITAWSYVRNREDTQVFGRRLPQNVIRRALTMLLLGLAILVGSTMLISFLEHGSAAGQMGMMNILYETASGIGTVGLSNGFTALAGTGSRIVLVILMYLGRVGMLTLALSLGSRPGSDPLIRYPEESVMIG